MAKQKAPVVRRTPPRVPKSRLWNLAKKIVNMPKDSEAVYNTLKDVYSDAYGDGYERNTDDRRFFKEKKEKARRESFNSFKDSIDDLIHNKNQNIR